MSVHNKTGLIEDGLQSIMTQRAPGKYTTQPAKYGKMWEMRHLQI